jgi:hypothetical protein
MKTTPFPYTGLSGKYLYVATGFADGVTNDALVTIDVKENKVVDIAPKEGNFNSNNDEPHHSGFINNGNGVAYGGLLSVLYNDPDVFNFDITDKAKPKYIDSSYVNRNPPNPTDPNAPIQTYSAADAFLPYGKDGKYLLSMMGGPGGGSPGCIAEFDKNNKLTGMWPNNLPLDYPYNPHGFDYNQEKDLLISGSFVIPVSAVVGPVVTRKTVEIYENFSVNHKITRTLICSGGNGLMSVLFIPNHPQQWAYACGDGLLYLVKPYEQNDELAVTLVYSIPPDLSGYLSMSADGKRLTAPTMSNLSYLNIEDPEHPFISDYVSIVKYYKGQFLSRKPIGSHFSIYSPDQDFVYSTDYFITTPIITDTGDKKLWRCRATKDEIINDPALEIDFNHLKYDGKVYEARGHGILVYPTDGVPNAPVVYEKYKKSICKSSEDTIKKLLSKLEFGIYNQWYWIISLFYQSALGLDTNGVYQTLIESNNYLGLAFAEVYGNYVAAKLVRKFFLYSSQIGTLNYQISNSNQPIEFNVKLMNERAEDLAKYLSTVVKTINYEKLILTLRKINKYVVALLLALKSKDFVKAVKLQVKLTSYVYLYSVLLVEAIVESANECCNLELKMCNECEMTRCILIKLYLKAVKDVIKALQVCKCTHKCHCGSNCRCNKENNKVVDALVAAVGSTKVNGTCNKYILSYYYNKIIKYYNKNTAMLMTMS